MVITEKVMRKGCFSCLENLGIYLEPDPHSHSTKVAVRALGIRLGVSPRQQPGRAQGREVSMPIPHVIDHLLPRDIYGFGRTLFHSFSVTV